MTITLPAGHPALAQLREEGLEVADASGSPGDAAMRIALVNLMPRKEVTELAFARLLAQTGRRISLTLVIPTSYNPRHVSLEHLARFYRRWPDIKSEPFDAVVVTGAPVETLPFEEVAYWSEFCEMVDWAKSQVPTTLYVCWAAQAALYASRRVPKTALARKAFGVFEQEVLHRSSPLMQGMGGSFLVPVSRHTSIDESLLAAAAGTTVIAGSTSTGPCIVDDEPNRAVYMFDHFEYEPDTLQFEYERDLKAGKEIEPPRMSPLGWTWQAAAALFFRNWLNRIPGESSKDESVAWLLDNAGQRPGQPRLLIQATPQRHLLTQTLALLHRAGFAPTSAQVRSSDGATVEVILAETGVSEIERAATALLQLPGTRRVVYRGATGFGGVLRPPKNASVPWAA
jgi:homoserine O-succinyltransferase/O-acetyltransferase